MSQHFTCISMVHLRRRRPGALLMKLAWVLCLLVVLVGLLEGKGLIAAIAPVGVALAYLCVRVDAPSKETAALPVSTQVELTADELRVTRQDIDRQDNKGPYTEVIVFPFTSITRTTFYKQPNMIMFEGSGTRTVTYRSNAAPRSHELPRLDLYISDADSAAPLIAALSADSRLHYRVLSD